MAEYVHYLEQSFMAGAMMEMSRKRLEAYAADPPEGVTVTLGQGCMHDSIVIEVDETVDLEATIAEMSGLFDTDLPDVTFTAEAPAGLTWSDE